MSLIYRLLADVVVVVHAAYVLFVILGLICVFIGWWRGWAWVRGMWFRGIHLAMILIVVLESWFGIICPLTVWEYRLRELAGQSTYRGDFIAQIVHDMLFFELPPSYFTLIYTIFGLGVIAALILVPPRRQPRHTVAQAGQPDTAVLPSQGKMIQHDGEA